VSDVCIIRDDCVCSSLYSISSCLITSGLLNTSIALSLGLSIINVCLIVPGVHYDRH
jgi:hypothetical protein